MRDRTAHQWTEMGESYEWVYEEITSGYTECNGNQRLLLYLWTVRPFIRSIYFEPFLAKVAILESE